MLNVLGHLKGFVYQVTTTKVKAKNKETPSQQLTKQHFPSQLVRNKTNKGSTTIVIYKYVTK